jgi:predicted outer membrane repeat protein
MASSRVALLVCLPLAGCPQHAPGDNAPGSDSADTANNGDSNDAIDADGDGVPASDDCNDLDPEVGRAPTWYADFDGDGFGDPSPVGVSCDQPAHTAAVGGDCDDNRPDVNPAATEICDGLDNDCSAATSEDGLVTLDGAANYTDLAKALLASSDGSILEVCAGTWPRLQTSGHDVTLHGVAGADRTILDGEGEGPALLVPDGDIVLSGFTLRSGVGASIPDYQSYTGGGCLMAWEASSVLVSDCVLTGCTADFGGGVMGSRSGVTTLSSTRIEGNTASQSGGGAYVLAAAMSGLSVGGNEAAMGGGIFVGAGTATATEVEISANGADQGGGLYLSGASFEANELRLVGNDASTVGGAVYAEEGSTLTGALASGNTAYDGAGIYASGEVDLVDVTLEANVASNNGGGAYLHGGAVLDHLLVDGNSARYGGGLMLDSGISSMSATEIMANSASQSGGGIVLADGELTVVSTIVQMNEAPFGGGFMIEQGSVAASTGTRIQENTAASGGGGLYVYGAGTWQGGTFSDNEAPAGGGLYLWGITTLDSVTVTENVSSGQGGGVFCGYDTILDTVVVGSNLADQGAGLYVGGAAIVRVESSGVTRNTAATRGGGAYVGDGTLQSTDSDWGASGTDNGPDDVATPDASYDAWGTCATFSCSSATGCN